MQKIRIVRCTKLKVLEGVPALDSLELEDTTMDTLPEYLQAVNPRYLEVAPNGTRSATLEGTTLSASKIEMQTKTGNCVAASKMARVFR